MRLSLLAGRWALTPPFHYYPDDDRQGYLFSVVLSVPDKSGPVLSHGTMPNVARTFLTHPDVSGSVR